MKKIITIFALLIISVTLAFADLLENKYEYEELFEISKETGKPVLLYFQNNSCGWCKHMNKTTFQNKDVIEFLEKNYLFFNINTDEPKYDKINERFKIKAGPSFLILDSDAFIYHKFLGFKDSTDFIKYFNKMLDRKNSLSYYKDKYESGIRDKEFLYDYCLKLHSAGELDSVRINDYLNTLDYKELFEEKNLKFLFDFAYYNRKNVFPENSQSYKFIKNDWKEFERISNEEQAKVRYIHYLNQKVYNAIKRNNYIEFIKYLKLLKEYERDVNYYYENSRGDFIRGIIATNIEEMAKIDFYKTNYPDDKYPLYIDTMLNNLSDKPERLNTLVYWKQLGIKPGEKQDELKELKSWIEISLKAKEFYFNTDTHAEILYKLGKYEKAKKEAELAIELAKVEGIADYSYTDRLLKRIEKAMKKQNN